MNFSALTIFGPGLIGGSIAKAARRAKLCKHIYAVDRRGIAVSDVFDEWVASDNDERVRELYRGSDLVILATPVSSIMAELPRALEEAPLVTDCGSTKFAIVKQAQELPNRARFVPGHPMAGLPEGGFAHARDDLFDNRTWLFCGDGFEDASVERVAYFVEALGARVVHLDAASHDRSVAITSHVPQVFASALLNLATAEQALGAAGPGFASATRVAGGAASMWSDIFDTNSAEVGRALELLGAELSRVGKTLSAGELSGVLDVLERARAARRG
jgi:prephenate dehydrogenase